MLKIALWFSLALPLAWISFRFFIVGPSANPAQELNHLFGRIAIYALASNLFLGHFFLFHRALTKRFPWLSGSLITLKKFRRHLGVAGWTYLAVHIAFHFVMEAGILEGVDAIWHAQYLWLGAAAASCITLLAITSNNLSQKLLGRYWTYLHRSVYIAFILAILHTLLIEKADTPHFSAIAVLTLLPYSFRLVIWALRQRR